MTDILDSIVRFGEQRLGVGGDAVRKQVHVEETRESELVSIAGSVYIESRMWLDAPEAIADDERMQIEASEVDPFVPLDALIEAPARDYLCPRCAGTRALCGRCHGGGRVPCIQCFGGDPNRMEEVRHYEGDGMYSTYTHYHRGCPHCSGTGTVTCPDCVGTGRFTSAARPPEACPTCGAQGSVRAARTLRLRRWTVTHRHAIGAAEIPDTITRLLRVAHTDEGAALDFVASLQNASGPYRGSIPGPWLNAAHVLERDLASDLLDPRFLRALHRRIEVRSGRAISARCRVGDRDHEVLRVNDEFIDPPLWLADLSP